MEKKLRIAIKRKEKGLERGIKTAVQGNLPLTCTPRRTRPVNDSRERPFLDEHALALETCDQFGELSKRKGRFTQTRSLRDGLLACQPAFLDATSKDEWHVRQGHRSHGSRLGKSTGCLQNTRRRQGDWVEGIGSVKRNFKGRQLQRVGGKMMVM